jgi:hypothetical protein
MIKRLSLLGQVESGLADAVAGKSYAFVTVPIERGREGVHQPGCNVGLGVAIEDEPGYLQVPVYWCHADSWTEMEAHAAELNRELGHTDEAAAIIIASSMGAQNRRDGGVRP